MVRAELWVVRANSVKEMLDGLAELVVKAESICRDGNDGSCRRAWGEVVRRVVALVEDARLFEGPMFREVGSKLAEVLDYWREFREGVMSFEDFRSASVDVISKARIMAGSLLRFADV